MQTVKDSSEIRLCVICGKRQPRGAVRLSCGKGTACLSELLSRSGKEAKKMRAHRESIQDRIIRRMEIVDDCWEWKGAVKGHPDGKVYGTMEMKGQEFLVHRASYMAFIGPIPASMDVLHTCDNTICVNPDHLVAGTRSDQVLMAFDRGRHGKMKITNAQRHEIVRRYLEGELQADLARGYGVNSPAIYNIIENAPADKAEAIKRQKNNNRLLGNLKKANLTIQDAREIHELFENGETKASIARRFGIHHKTVRKVLAIDDGNLPPQNKPLCYPERSPNHSPNHGPAHGKIIGGK